MLSCVDVTKSFDGVIALDRVSVSFAPGELCAVIGPNGAGKTTLLNVLTGFVRPDGGRCILGAAEITDLMPNRIARQGLARTFQDLRLVRQLSVLENILLAFPDQLGESLLRAICRFGVSAQDSALRSEASDILSRVGLAEIKQRMAGELSYGQQKLLTVASCIATRADILLLDEPVSGVDPATAEKVLEVLADLRSHGKTLVFVEHDISAVRHVANRVVVMNQGAVIADGPPQEVLERRDILEAYLT
jgi:ABC-type branched-subunit amino acid transport system ATPase component